MDLLELLKSVELFEGLTDTQLKRLVDIGQTMKVDKGTAIFAQGDQGDRLYLVYEGQVQVQFAEDFDSPRAQVFLGRGQIFGEIALIDRGPRSATMMCVRDNTLLYTIARDAFTRLCEDDTAIGYIVMRNIAADLSFKLRHRNISNS